MTGHGDMVTLTRESVVATNGVTAVYSHATGTPSTEDASGSEGRNVASLRPESEKANS